MGAESELEEDQSDDCGDVEGTLWSENRWYGNRTGDDSPESQLNVDSNHISSKRKWLCSMHCTKTLYVIIAHYSLNPVKLLMQAVIWHCAVTIKEMHYNIKTENGNWQSTTLSGISSVVTWSKAICNHGVLQFHWLIDQLIRSKLHRTHLTDFISLSPIDAYRHERQTAHFNCPLSCYEHAMDTNPLQQT